MREPSDGQAGEAQLATARRKEPRVEEDVAMEEPLDLNADISLQEMQMMQAMGIPFVRTPPPPPPVRALKSTIRIALWLLSIDT